MLFNSFSFAIFLPITFALFWIVPKKLQWVVLFVASYIFYMCWNPEYILLILLTTAVSYVGAIMIERNATKKRLFLTISLVISLSVLFFFKYFNFVSKSVFTGVNSIFNTEYDPILLNIILPVGISFYTFQTLGYVIDVYRGTVRAERHFGKYATFISFFPQLVAGPIERTSNLLNQIKEEHKFDSLQAAYGLRLMLWGFFKKMVVADNLAVFVNKIYESPTSYDGFALIASTVFFAIQIYCDFSGYSDIAIGTAKLFGINLMTNFDTPYFATSIKGFWSRWHISLSTWFKDYIYIPLGGNRVSKLRHKLNLIITFLISGLWHGANWNFVIWGGIHGVAQAAESALPKRNSSNALAVKIFKGLGVFTFVLITWVFFRAQTIFDAWHVLTRGFVGITNPIAYLRAGFNNMGMGEERLIICIFAILILFVYELASQKRNVIEWVGSKKRCVSWSMYFVLTLIILAWTPVSSASEFIYFQF